MALIHSLNINLANANLKVAHAKNKQGLSAFSLFPMRTQVIQQEDVKKNFVGIMLIFLKKPLVPNIKVTGITD